MDTETQVIETQEETLELETQEPESMVVEESATASGTAETEGSGAEPSASEAKPKPKRQKAPDTLTREPGKSVFPHTRVQKILKADKVPSPRATAPSALV